MPGSGDSVQALKAGIMEIPDVIAINKMDHPAAKTMLNEVRSILALDRDREWRPPIVLTEAVRGENVAELWGKIEEHRALLESNGLLEERRRKNLARRGVRGRLEPGEDASQAEVADNPELAGCSTRCRRGSSIRSRRCVRSLSRYTESTMATQRQHRHSLTSRRRAPDRRDRARHAGLRVRDVSRLAGRPVQLKAENLQRTGSFKIRGAVNTIASLTPAERAAGVVAASAGNHGQAVAWAAREAGIAATIFMPQDSPMAKVDATRNYGARVELVGAGFDESLAGRAGVRRRERRDVRPRLRGRARDRRARDDRRSSSSSSCRISARWCPDRRRRARRRGSRSDCRR